MIVAILLFINVLTFMNCSGDSECINFRLTRRLATEYDIDDCKGKTTSEDHLKCVPASDKSKCIEVATCGASEYIPIKDMVSFRNQSDYEPKYGCPKLRTTDDEIFRCIANDQNKHCLEVPHVCENITYSKEAFEKYSISCEDLETSNGKKCVYDKKDERCKAKGSFLNMNIILGFLLWLILL